MKLSEPTQEQIDKEIATLKATLPKIRPYDIFGGNNKTKLQATIDALNGDIDETAPEYDDMDPDERSNADEAFGWMDGSIKDAPSKGWKGLVQK